MKQINTEYARKTTIAGEMANAAWLAGGLDGMRDELASLRRVDADSLISGHFEHLYHKQCLRVLPEQR